MSILSILSRIPLGLSYSLLLTFSASAIEPEQAGKASLPSQVEISRILTTLDAQIDKVDQLIVSMEQQVEAQYQQVNETYDYTVRARLEEVAMQMGEKLMQMQELREQMRLQRNQTEELMHEIDSNN